MQLELGADSNYRPRRIINPLAEQVLAEAALLTLDHVGKRLQGPVVRTKHRTPTPIVIEEGVDGMLQHALLVANNHIRRIQIEKLLETVIPVDQAPVEIVQIRGGEVAALQQDQGPQIRRDDRHDIQHHPLRLVAGIEDGLDDLEPLDEILRLLLALGGSQLGLELLGELLKIDVENELAHRLGAGIRLEGVTVLLPAIGVLFLGEKLVALELGISRIDNNVILVVDDPLERGCLHGQEISKARRSGLEEPDMHTGSGKIDMPHPLAADPGVSDLDSTAVADNTAVLDPFVLPAEALPVTLRPENPLAEQTILLGTIGTIVDRFGLFHLTIGPGQDVVG